MIEWLVKQMVELVESKSDVMKRIEWLGVGDEEEDGSRGLMQSGRVSSEDKKRVCSL